MAKGLFIIGTDTDVGKTVITAGLADLFHQNGHNPCYFKPALSGAYEGEKGLIPGDTRFVKNLIGLEEEDTYLTPYIFKSAVSPHLAAILEEKAIDIEVIKEQFEAIGAKYEYVMAEGCGGLAVPLTQEGYMLYDLIKDLGLPIIVVARAGVGTINHTFLTVKQAQIQGIKVLGIIINGYTAGDICQEDNIKIIEQLTGIQVIGKVPKIKGLDMEGLKYGDLREKIAKAIDFPKLLKMLEGDVNP